MNTIILLPDMKNVKKAMKLCKIQLHTIISAPFKWDDVSIPIILFIENSMVKNNNKFVCARHSYIYNMLTLFKGK